MGLRREYPVKLYVNRIFITRVVIDPHYEEKHKASMSDELILDIVQLLDGEVIDAVEYKKPFSYFVTKHRILNGKTYKLIWLREDNDVYLGVVNAYRSK